MKGIVAELVSLSCARTPCGASVGRSPGEQQVERGSSCSSSTVPPLHLTGCEPEVQSAAVLPAAALTPADSPALPPAQRHQTLLSDLSKPQHRPAAADSASTEQLLEAGGHAIHRRVNKTWSFLQLVAFPYNRDQFAG